MIDFLTDFHTEEQCLAALEEIRWSSACPKCWCTEYWRHGKRRVRICSGCRSSLRVTAWTVLDRLRIPLRAVFLIGWFMVTSKQGISAEELSSLVGVSPPTAWMWNNKFRRIMVMNDRTKLQWHVEVDEVFLWWVQEWPRWRWAKGKVIVVIAVEINMDERTKKSFFRWMWRVRIQVIKNCGAETLTKFINDNVEKDSTIYTDGWPSYNGVDKEGYHHILQTGSVSNDAILWVHTEKVTPNVHIIASLVKRWLLGTHQKYCTQDGYLQEYLEEYTFRFNRRKSSDRGKLFQTLLKQILSHKPTTRNAITKHIPWNWWQVASS